MSRGLLTIMATVTQLGLVVVTIGLLFYVSGDEVIVEQDAGTLLGPAMVLGSMATVFFVLARTFGVADLHGERRPGILRPALVASAGGYVAMLVIGSVIYALERREAIWVILFAARYAVSTFVIASSMWAGIVVAGFLVLARYDTAPTEDTPRHDDL